MMNLYTLGNEVNIENERDTIKEQTLLRNGRWEGLILFDLSGSIILHE